MENFILFLEVIARIEQRLLFGDTVYTWCVLHARLMCAFLMKLSISMSAYRCAVNRCSIGISTTSGWEFPSFCFHVPVLR